MALINWDTVFQGTPAGTDPVSVIDDRFHDLKEQISRRGEQGGHIYTEDPNTPPAGHGVTPDSSKDGRHVVDGGGAGIGPDIYKSNAADKLVTWADTGATMAAGSNWLGGNVSSGNNPGHGHDNTMVIYLPASETGVVKAACVWNQGNGNLTLLAARMFCWTAPTLGNVLVNIEKITGMTDPNTGGVSVMGASLRILTGNYIDDGTASIATPTLAVGDAWRFNIITFTAGDACEDLTVVLKVRRA